MSRPLRIEFDGAFYHVTSRGNTRYVIQNPLRAGMVQNVSDYPWSSYNFVTGKAPTSDFSVHKTQALQLFVQFVNENKQQDLWENLSHQTFLGDDNFTK